MAPKDGRGYLVPASLLTPTDAPVFRWDAGYVLAHPISQLRSRAWRSGAFAPPPPPPCLL